MHKEKRKINKSTEKAGLSMESLGIFQKIQHRENKKQIKINRSLTNSITISITTTKLDFHEYFSLSNYWIFGISLFCLLAS